MIDFPASPSVGQIFTAVGLSWKWDGTKWVTYTVGSTGSSNDVGRNLIHNPLFNIAQRGVGPWTANGYTADRWQIGHSLDTATVTLNQQSDTGRTQIGDEASVMTLQNVFTGNAGGGSFTILAHHIESIQRLSGKTITLSFWAIAGAALKLGVSIDQNFGTGGSPSAQVNGAGQSVTLSTTWARYVLTFAVPSAAAKVFGTSGDNSVLNFWYSAEASNNVRSGTVGVQSGTISLWGVQLETGSVATPLEKPDPQQDLAKCQRFYQTGSYHLMGYGVTNNLIGYQIPLPVTMRATPTGVQAVGTATNLNGGSASMQTTPGSVAFLATVAASNPFDYAGTYTVSADL